MLEKPTVERLKVKGCLGATACARRLWPFLTGRSWLAEDVLRFPAYSGALERAAYQSSKLRGHVSADWELSLEGAKECRMRRAEALVDARICMRRPLDAVGLCAAHVLLQLFGL